MQSKNNRFVAFLIDALFCSIYHLTIAGALDPFSQDCLDAHNSYRAKHGVPPLMWSHDLAEGAQVWADQLASTDSFQHDQVAIQNRKIGKIEHTQYFHKGSHLLSMRCFNCFEQVLNTKWQAGQ